MGDSFNRLRHDAVVGSDHENDEIGDFRTARTHVREGFVTRRIEEHHAAAVGQTQLRRDFGRPASKSNPIVAAELCGTSVTSTSRPQYRTQENVARNPHMLYGRSDKRGYMLVEVTPQSATARFMGLDDVRDARSGQSEVAVFAVTDHAPGVRRA